MNRINKSLVSFLHLSKHFITTHDCKELIIVEPKEILQQVSDTIQFGKEKKPDIQNAFMNFNSAVLSPGKLETKTKELIALALSLSSTCEWCITYHVNMAKEHGATDEEILEASYVAVLMAGAPALMHMTLVKKALESL